MKINEFKKLIENEFTKLVCNKTISDFKLDFDNDVVENDMLTVDAQVKLNGTIRQYTINKSDFPELTQDEFTKMCSEIKMEIEKDLK